MALDEVNPELSIRWEKEAEWKESFFKQQYLFNFVGAHFPRLM